MFLATSLQFDFAIAENLSKTRSVVIGTPVASAGVWSKKRTKSVTTAVAKHYHIGKKGRAWLRRAVVDIVYTGAHESGGSTNCTTGSHVGIFQFNTSWHLTKWQKKLKKKMHFKRDWRRSGKLSIYRFVKVYQVAGKSKIKQHWVKTYGK